MSTSNPPTQEIQITASPSPMPHLCKFTVDRPVYPGASYSCHNADAAQGSPLLEALFQLDGVSRILVEDAQLTVEKREARPWAELAREVGSTIRSQLQKPGPWINPPAVENPAQDQALYQRIQAVLEEHVNPGVAAHGGFVELVEVKDADAYLRLGGGCQGCSSANVTLKQGIERMIRTQIPEVRFIHDVTDHASGQSPYYK